MNFDSFKREYDSPAPGTAVSLESLRLERSPGLSAFASAVGGGVFANGFLSLISVREAIPSLMGWERYLPQGARLFGSSAFGVLLTTTGEAVWIVETQYGQVMESDYPLPDFIELLATDEVRNEFLRQPLFQSWNEIVGDLPPTEVLCPTPALPLGGTWSVDSLSATNSQVYLSFTFQLFGKAEGTRIEVHRRMK